jgi:hypothetical protein
MALIRGVGSLYPCPRCLVADVDLDSFPNRSQARTAQQTKATIEEAREQDLVGESEEILKDCGLRDIDVRSHFIFNLFYYLPINNAIAEHILEDKKLGPT